MSKLKWLGLIAVAILAPLACDLDPCQSLELKVCGPARSCAEHVSCIEVRRMAGNHVRAACEAALENEVSFPLCRRPQ